MRSFVTASALLLLAALFLPLNTTTPATAQEGDTAPYNVVECPVNMPTDVECGFVTVPRDRDNPDEGNIRIATMIMFSTAAAPLADPVVYLDGGPGGTTIETAPLQFSSVYEPWLSERDVVIFDQRGIGFSEPALNCDGLLELEYDLLDEDQPLEEVRTVTLDAVDACIADLSAATDLADFNSTENGADVPEVLQALGYSEWNLYGISYGTMLAQYVLRDNPAGTRSVILDSNVPLTLDLFETIPSSFRGALDELIAECAALDACDAAYPDLGTAIDEAYAALNAEPAVLQITDALTGESYTVFVDGDVMMGAMFLALYSSQLTALLPRAVYEILDGQTDTLSILLQQQVTQIPFGTTIMYGSVMCTDEVPFNSAADLDAATTDPALGETLISYFASDVPTMFDICDSYAGLLEDTPLSNEAVQSDVPALIVGGQFDPITPPAFSDVLAEGFSNAFVYEFPASGHGATTETDCAQQVMTDFLTDPTTAPNITCIDEIPLLNFVVPVTELTLVETEIDAAGVVVLLPEGWEAVGGTPGVYAPAGSPTNVFLVQVVPLTLDATVDAVGPAFTDDGVAPELSETLEGENFTWNLYDITFQGLPGTIALAEQDGQTTLVLLVTASADRDAFVELFLVPALQSLRPLE
jgi:pimeloyl-ACP methyl ester carboxylesterase